MKSRCNARYAPPLTDDLHPSPAGPLTASAVLSVRHLKDYSFRFIEEEIIYNIISEYQPSFFAFMLIFQNRSHTEQYSVYQIDLAEIIPVKYPFIADILIYRGHER